jgi:simple sugar transport system substrate-binding protein
MRDISKLFLLLTIALVAVSGAFAQSTPPAAGPNLTIGLVMVGPYNDHGWSQANYDGLQYVLAKVPGTKLVYIDKANSADRPGTTYPSSAKASSPKVPNSLSSARMT